MDPMSTVVVVGSFITSFNLRCAMFSRSLIAATPPVDRQEKSSCADKDSPSARRDSFCESAFPTLRRAPTLCLRQRARPCEGSFKVDVQTVSRKFNSQFETCWPIYDISLASKLTRSLLADFYCHYYHRLYIDMMYNINICI